MSNIIKLLPDSVANQIAAGEVIQRPASAVKELLENAVDAKAAQITLVIKDAGKTLIQVTDNGNGMNDMDARMCFERHATSKIEKADDLFAIKTMGFRGEAMASIAAIAQVELKSKTTNDEIGTCIKIEGSEVISQEPCQCATGTTISIKNLFFNVPARRSFLKSDTVEIRHIIEEFIRVASVNSNISFIYYNNEKLVFKLMPGSFKSRVVSLFGNTYNEKLIAVEQKTDKLTISGFIGKPEFAKKTRGEQYFFVNNRFIKHHYLHHAVANSYTELIPSGSYPSYFIIINIDPKEIDINIHPTKTEINFLDARYVYSILQAAVKQSIGKHTLTPTIDFDVIPEVEAAFQARPNSDLQQPSTNINPDYNPFTNSSPSPKPSSWSSNKPDVENWEALYQNQSADNSPELTHQQVFSKVIEKETEFDRNNFLQAQNQYIICNVSNGLMIINQHLAHERIIYESTLERLKGKSQPSQQQLFPQNLHLSPGDSEIIVTLIPELSKIGFMIEQLGKSNFVITGVPTNVDENDVVGLIEKIIENHKLEISDLNYDKNVNLARALASNLSIKKGVKLNNIEMKDIFDKLFMCNVPKVSPNGEKIFSIISITELDNFIQLNS